MRARFLDISLLILLSALWGGSYLFIRIAGPSLGPVVLMALRVSIAAALLFVYLGALRQWPDFRRHWKPFFVMGILNNVVPFILIANAVIHLNASIAAILNGTTPLFTALVAAWWIKEPFGPRQVVGVVLGMVGVAVLVGWSPLPLTPGAVVAALQALLAALSYGVAAVHARRQFMGVPPLHAALGQLSGSTALLLPLGVFWLPQTPPDARVAFSVVGLAVACTALAYVMYFRLIATTGATAAATVTCNPSVSGGRRSTLSRRIFLVRDIFFWTSAPAFARVTLANLGGRAWDCCGSPTRSPSAVARSRWRNSASSRPSPPSAPASPAPS